MSKDVWRFIDLAEKEPWECRALREVITEPTFTIACLRTYALLGAKTSINDINVAECVVRNIPIVRGIESGGASLYTPSVLNFCVFYPENEANKAVQFMVEACKNLGLLAIPKLGSNDVVINGRKATGRSDDLERRFFSGMYTIDFDYDLADAVLQIPDNKFYDKTHKTVRDWVTSMSKEAGRVISMEEGKQSLLDACETVYDCKLVPGELSVAEETRLAELEEKFHSEEWVNYGKWSDVKEYWRP